MTTKRTTKKAPAKAGAAEREYYGYGKRMRKAEKETLIAIEQLDGEAYADPVAEDIAAEVAAGTPLASMSACRLGAHGRPDRHPTA